jgi:hypothetical protein
MTARKIVAIHQPNYLPWLGYFHKIAAADIFVFLDDVPFSKGSYINRVKILANGQGRWLSVPVSVHLGDPINRVAVAKPNWMNSHMATLSGWYRDASAFCQAWPRLSEILSAAPDADLAAINRFLVEAISRELGLACCFKASSDIDVDELTGDERLIALTNSAAAGAVYLSGKGGANYQNEEKFTAAGLKLRYTDYPHPVYPQAGGDADFVAGLSVLDAILNLGWDGASSLLKGTPERP